MRETTDILVSGGGIAGLTAAAAFGAAGFRVICVDPDPPVTSEAAAGSDLRTTAFLQPSIPVLQAAGLWERLEPHAAPLQIMRIIDAGGPTPDPRIVKDFDARDISDLPFGWNLPNWLLRREMAAAWPRCRTSASAPAPPPPASSPVRRRRWSPCPTAPPSRPASSSPPTGATRPCARPWASRSGPCATARRHWPSPSRTRSRTRTSRPRSTAPAGPSPSSRCPTATDSPPRPSSGWRRARGRPPRRPAAEDFEAEIDSRSCRILGPLKLASRRTVWPIISQIAERMAGQRTALLAEAAHVVPPSARRASTCRSPTCGSFSTSRPRTRARSAPPGCSRPIHRARHWEVQLRVTGIDALNRASMMGAPVLRNLRAAGLDALYSLAPLRRTMMRAGLGVR